MCVVTRASSGCCFGELLLQLLLLVVAGRGVCAWAAPALSLQVGFEALEEVTEDDGVEYGLDGGDEEEENAHGVGEGLVLVEAVCLWWIGGDEEERYVRTSVGMESKKASGVKRLNRHACGRLHKI